jgi:hypothetical protein
MIPGTVSGFPTSQSEERDRLSPLYGLTRTVECERGIRGDPVSGTNPRHLSRFHQQAQVKEGPKMTDIVRGAAIKGMTRPSKRFNEGRVCAKKGCSTKLSQYNKAEYCHAHAPVRFPRVRGKIMDGQDA